MSQPLGGLRVVVTRPVRQAGELVDRLAALGAQVVELPLTAVRPVEDVRIDQALDRISGYDVIVVTSANGAVCLAERLTAKGVAPARETRVVAVGAATAAALRAGGLAVDHIPQRATGEAIAAELSGTDLTATRILLPRPAVGRPELPAALRRAGAVVDDVPFYETVPVPVTADAVATACAADVIVFTAPSGVEAFTEVADRDAAAALRVVTIGPTTSQAARDAGLTVSAESREQSVDGLIAAIRSVSTG